MGVHVAAAEAAGGEGRVRGLIAPRPPVLLPRVLVSSQGAERR
jgi:hypothetical protein